MFDAVFRRSVATLDPSAVAFLRPWIETSARVPAPPYTGACRLSHQHARLMLSLTYGAGVRVSELARMEVDALVDETGHPRSHVFIKASTTKQLKSRKVAMHPDIRRDVLAFNSRHPGQRFVAFVPLADGAVRPEPMTASGLTLWFRELYRNAGFDQLHGDSGPRMFNAMSRAA